MPPFGFEDDYQSKYEEIEQIGEGAAAVVKKCRHKEENTVYATKVMRNRDLEKEIASRAEFDLLNGLEEHPHIIKAKEFISTEQWTYFVMEYANGLELQEYLERFHHSYSQHKSSLTRKIISGLLSGVAHLHSARICHKDIKPENIMVDIQGEELVSLKLVDFNISQKVQNDRFTMIAKNGTKMFIAPEME
jgi:serine/threonine protein kinase